MTLLALTQWMPYAGYFLAGWALRDTRLSGAPLAGTTVITLAAICMSIVQYGSPSSLALVNAALPVSYFGPIVAVSAVGVFLCANSLLDRWCPAPKAQRFIRELSDSAFGVFLVHFVLMVLVRKLDFFASADNSFGLSLLEWAVVVISSFLIVGVMRRVPVIRRLV